MRKDQQPTSVCHLPLGGVQLSGVSTDNSAPRTFSGVAHSGKPFVYKGQRAIVDLSTLSHKDAVPALLLHDRAARVGVGRLAVGADGLTISGTLLDNEHGKQVAAEADQGFPWQMSAHIDPARVESLPAGKTASVNGQTVTGPILILRNSDVREVSFTPTGVDRNTHAAVLGDEENPDKSNPQESNVNLEEALAKIGELEKQVETLQKKNDELTKEKEDLAAENRAAQVDAQLSAAGYVKSKDGKGWQGLSEKTYEVLLAAEADTAKAMIADLAPKNEQAAGWLMSETHPGENKPSGNALLDDAVARGKGGAYV
nr:MAG TPA: prohead serine protease [Caudoviricetes sp.]